MQDDGYIPPMSPEDFAALAAFAGPIYQESKIIEAYTSNNPMPGTFTENGSMSIREGLEQAKRLAQAAPKPVYTTPAIVDTPIAVQPPQPIPIGIEPQPTDRIQDQLEFSFNADEQSVTNDLLREISKKLSKVVILLEGGGVKDVGPKKPKPSITEIKPPNVRNSHL